MDILVMTADHVEQVAALERCCFADPWSRESIASELENPLALWLVAMEDGFLVGYVGSQIVPDEADVMNLAVQPGHRRRGTARLLMERLFEELKNRGVRTLKLEVRPSNTGAVALYTALGFTQAGRRPNYYRHPREDAYILAKEL